MQENFHLSSDASIFVERLEALLTELGKDPAEYRQYIEPAANLWGEYIEAARLVNSNGLLLKPLHGNPYANPAIKIKKDALAGLPRYFEAMGLDSRSRARLAKAAEERIVNIHGDDLAF